MRNYARAFKRERAPERECAITREKRESAVGYHGLLPLPLP